MFWVFVILLLVGLTVQAILSLTSPAALLVLGADVGEGRVLANSVLKFLDRWYVAQLAYDYVVDGDHFSSTVDLWPPAATQELAQAKALQFPVGSAIKVRYSGAKPEVSTVIGARLTVSEWLAVLSRLCTYAGGLGIFLILIVHYV